MMSLFSILATPKLMLSRKMIKIVSRKQEWVDLFKPLPPGLISIINC